MSWIRTRCGELFYPNTGTWGATVLLVHGWGGKSPEWCSAIARLAPSFRVIAVDLAGHGHSGRAPTAPRELAADLAYVLAQVAAEGVVALGHSMGAKVVTALSVEHPGTADALVVIDPAYAADDDEAALLPARYAVVVRDGWPAALDILRGSFTFQTPPRVRLFHWREFQAMDARVLASAYAGIYLEPGAFGPRAAAERYLRRCAMPTLALLTSPLTVAWLAGHLRGVGSADLTWPSNGHYLHEEQPEQVADAITARLKETAGGTR